MKAGTEGIAMATMEQCKLLDVTYRKYRKDRPVDREDVWAVERLSESDLLRVYFEDGRPFATATRGR